VHKIDGNDKEGKLLKALARGLNPIAKRFKGFIINGYRFHTKDLEKKRTQNSGVMVEVEGEIWYGRLVDILELDYYGEYKVVVFQCEWVDINSSRGIKRDAYGGTCVNFSKLIHTGQYLKDDPFIFYSQAKQVFYLEDAKDEGWLHVVKTKPRDLYELHATLESIYDDDDRDTYTQCLS